MVTITIGPSRQLALLLTLAHMRAAASALSVDISIWLKAALVLAVAGSLLHALNGSALRRSGRAIVALEIGEGAAASFKTRCGDWHKAVLLDSSFVAPYLTVLNLRTGLSRLAHHVVIMPDSVSAEDFRRLRVWLRWRKTATA